MTFAERIEMLAGGEEIVGVCVADEAGYPMPGVSASPVERWEAARQELDYQWNGTFGSMGHPVVAWTASWVIFLCEYDGDTTLSRLPRNPAPWKPRMF